MSSSLVELGLHHVTQRSRELQAGASLPMPPARVPIHEASDRVKLIRNLPREAFHVLCFSMEASALQASLVNGSLVKNTTSPQILLGTIPIPEEAEICRAVP